MHSAGYLILLAAKNAALGSPMTVARAQGASVPVSVCAGGFGVLLALLLPGGALLGFVLKRISSAFGCCSAKGILAGQGRAVPGGRGPAGLPRIGVGLSFGVPVAGSASPAGPRGKRHANTPPKVGTAMGMISSGGPRGAGLCLRHLSALRSPSSLPRGNLVSPCQGQPGGGRFWASSGRVTPTPPRPIQRQVVTCLGSACSGARPSAASRGQEPCRGAPLRAPGGSGSFSFARAPPGPVREQPWASRVAVPGAGQLRGTRGG